jgi:hypothetical protein
MAWVIGLVILAAIGSILCAPASAMPEWLGLLRLILVLIATGMLARRAGQRIAGDRHVLSPSLRGPDRDPGREQDCRLAESDLIHPARSRPSSDSADAERISSIASAFAVYMLMRRYRRGGGIQFIGKTPIVPRRGYQRHWASMRQALRFRRRKRSEHGR